MATRSRARAQGAQPQQPDASEVPKRLAPGTEVSRELWQLSGNECAWPGCSTRLLNENDDWVGEIAHIRGAKPGSARFDVSMTNKERADFENLLILCPTHHEQVDGTLLSCSS